MSEPASERSPMPPVWQRYGSLIALALIAAGAAVLVITADTDEAPPPRSAAFEEAPDGTGGSGPTQPDGSTSAVAVPDTDTAAGDVDEVAVRTADSIIAEALRLVPLALREALGDDLVAEILEGVLPSPEVLGGLDEAEARSRLAEVASQAFALESLPLEVVELLLPEGVMSFSAAERLGLDIDFGARCDPATGLLAIPVPYPSECVAPFSGDNGGATAPGVTADTIRIAYWASADDDPVLRFLTESIASDDTLEQIEDTLQGLIDYYEAYYETYGRRVELHVVEASGTIADPAAARTDAVRIAEEIDPFMVWGGPSLTNAFAEELAARGIACLGCGPGQTSDYYAENHPLAWSVLMGSEQLNLMVADYVGTRLAGRPAAHAGDPALAGQTRRFGRVYISTSDNAAALHERFKAELAQRGVELVAEVGYSVVPGQIEATAANIIARLKEAEVTTVVLTGDPRVPQTITRQATAQGYFPEWVITGTILTDTNVYGRTYDQQQWANAFGITPYTAKVAADVAGAAFRYRWFHGEPAPAPGNASLVDQYPALFFPVLNFVGPNLTVEGFANTLFAAQPTPTAITSTSVSFGDKGRWPLAYQPDYFGIDDVVELWWDAEATGPDELGADGRGLYRYVAGGRRYLFNDHFGDPATTPAVFDPEGTSLIYEHRPVAEPVGDYAPLPGSGQGPGG